MFYFSDQTDKFYKCPLEFTANVLLSKYPQVYYSSDQADKFYKGPLEYTANVLFSKIAVVVCL